MPDTPSAAPILVGLDGKPGAERALQWASAEYGPGATMVACFVLTLSHELLNDVTPPGLGPWRRQLPRDLSGPWTQSARSAGLDVRTMVVEADTVAGGLLETAGDVHARLIVVGLNGHGHITDRLLGATTYKLTHQATIPVVIVPTGVDSHRLEAC